LIAGMCGHHGDGIHVASSRRKISSKRKGVNENWFAAYITDRRETFSEVVNFAKY